MGKKLLIADDEQFITSAYNDGFQRAGFNVVVAHNGEEALQKITSEKPDIVLLDLSMPKMNGFEVLKKIKADPTLQTIPVLILSNLSQEADEAEVKKLGATGFIVKSDISLQDLIVQVNQIIT